MSGHLKVDIDGDEWRTVSDYSEYDAVHVVAGVLLAGAESVTVERVGGQR
jgi:hypothetical protein